MGKMKKYRQLIKELPSKKVVFAFGRFQPPTTGHELLVKAVQKIASAQGADHVIYASKTEDKKQNPLPVSRKVYYLQRMFAGANFKAANEQERTFIEAAKALNKRYKNIVMVAGSDRIAEYKKILEKYNGTEFKFDTVSVVSAGERDPDSDNASGMSGTKMREAAKAGKFSEFKKGIPHSLTVLDARRLMNEIRKAYDLEPVKESLNIAVDDLREKYFRGEIFNVGDIVISENKQCVVVKRGSNHLLLSEKGTDVKFTRWIKDVYLPEDYENPEDRGQVSWQGYTTKHFDLDTSVVDAFNNTIHSGEANSVDILHAIKEVDEYLGHMKAAIATRQASAEVVNNVKVHMARARDHLANIGQAEHHDNYLSTHTDQIEKLASDYKETGKEDMAEELTNKTLKSNSADQIKAARIIATTLGVENVESTTNPAQIVNLGLRKIKSKALNAESYEILKRMLKMATDVGIKFDTNLMPQKLKEAYYNKLLSYDAEGKLTEIDTDADGIPDWIEKNMTKIGSGLHNDDNDQLRTQKVRYHLGEADAGSLTRQVAKSALAAKHAKEKEALSTKHASEKESLKEYEISHDGKGNYRDDEGNEFRGAPRGSFARRHTITSTPPSEPHSVHINGKKWKSFSSQSHAQNVANKIKGATVHKEEYEHILKALDEALASTDKGEYDYEGAMARTQLQTVCRNAQELIAMLGMDENLPEWVQSKITLAQDYISSVTDYLKSRSELGEGVVKKPQYRGLSESSLNAKDPHGDYKEKSKALHQLSMNKDVDQGHVKQRKLDLDKEYSKYQKEDVKLDEEHIVHVDDGSKYGEQPHDKDAEHVMAGVKKHNGKFDGHSDKGAFFKFKSHSDAKNFVDHVKRSPHKTVGADLHEEVIFEAIDKEHPIAKEYESLKKQDIKTLRGMISQQHKIVDTSEFKTKDHAASHILRNRHGNKKVAAVFGLSEEQFEEGYLQSADKVVGKDGKKHTARLIKIGSDAPTNTRHKGYDAFSMEEVELSEEDIDVIVDEFQTWEDVIDAYEDDELAIIDEETGEEIDTVVSEGTLNEVLSRIERIRAKTRFARTKSKRMIRTKMALKRSSPQSVINTRARKLAIQTIKLRLAKKPLNTLSVAEKERLEQRIAKMKPVLNRIAMKLAPRVRQIEKQRLSHSTYTK
jgi:nicotinic acid mononucleotide adenylyltransferase